MNIKSGFLYLLIALILTSCTNGLTGYPSDTVGYSDADPKIYLASDDTAKRYFEATVSSDRQAIRDIFVFSKMREIDNSYQTFQRAIFAENSHFAFGSALTNQGLSLAGTIATGTQTLKILHALGAGVSGATSDYQNAVLYKQTLPALIALMEAKRAKLGAEILVGISQPVENYPLLRAQMDIQKYYLAGTIPGAIRSVSESATNTKNAAETTASLTKVTTFTHQTDDLSKLLREFLFDNGTYNTQNLNLFRQCSNKHSIDLGPLVVSGSPEYGDRNIIGIIQTKQGIPHRKIIYTCLKSLRAIN